MHLRSKRYGFPTLNMALLALLLALLTGLAGCGGGGGGGGGGTSNGNITVIGRVLVAETLLPPASATFTVNGRSATTTSTGNFALTNVPKTATTATVTASGEVTRTLTLDIPSGVTSLDLGDIYISAAGYGASASGTVVTPGAGGNVPVPGASVTIAGTTVLTATNGTFSVPNLPAGLGTDATTPIGTVRASGYVDKPILAPFVFTAGDNALGNLLIQTGVGTQKPGQPYTITGQVTHNGTPQSGIAVELLIPTAATPLQRTTTTDASGNYYFWVIPGQYSVATFINNVQGPQVSVNLVSADAPQTANLTY